jgi:hypothetical protein
MPSMSRIGKIVLALACLGTLSISAACNAAAPTDTAPAEPPTEASNEAASQPAEPTTEVASEEPSPVPTVVANADNCVSCHTNEGTLQAMAVEKDVTSEETEGEG